MTAISVQRLAKSFGPVRAVRDVSFEVESGEIFGILGPNGAGKTTTVECIGAMTRPDEGNVQVLGLDPHVEPRRVRKTLGYQMQSSTLPDQLRVREALRMFAAFYPAPADEAELLDVVGLKAASHHAFGTLSGGQQQRLSIALALIGRPRVVVLDEITTGLDPEGRRDVWALIEHIRSDGVTVLLVSHAIDEIERLCDRLCVIAGGQTIFTGTSEALIGLTAPSATVPGAASALEEAYFALVAHHGRQE